MSAPHPEVLWCSNRRGGGHGVDGWAFPRAIEQVLRDETAGMRVLQLFGGKSRWGVRLDVDRVVQPDVVGDAWLPPFGEGSFDAVILDPPYWRINTQEADGLLRSAAMVARCRVIWLHTVWMARRSYLEPVRSWLVRAADFSQCRCLQMFAPVHSKCTWPRYFTRGPALRYNKWLAGQAQLPLLAPPGPRRGPFGPEAAPATALRGQR